MPKEKVVAKEEPVPDTCGDAFKNAWDCYCASAARASPSRSSSFSRGGAIAAHLIHLPTTRSDLL